MLDDNKETRISKIQDYFRNAHSLAAPYFRRRDQIQMAFDGIIDDANWPTLSEINIPILRTAVLQIVPQMFEYLFPDGKFIELMPKDENVPFSAVSKVEDVLTDTLLNKMNTKRNGILTIQDAVKFGCGYGQVVRKNETHPQKKVLGYFAAGNAEGEQSTVVESNPVEVLDYRYIPYRDIIPTGDGDTPDDCTAVFHLDAIREDVLLAMYKEDRLNPAEDQIYKGDPEEIIKATVDGDIDGSIYPTSVILSTIAGEQDAVSKYRRTNDISRNAGSGPVIVPVLKCYFKGHHIWLANGDTIMYEVKDTVETLTCPILKASSCLDSGNWWCQSDVSASKDVSDGIVIFRNAMMDLITKYLHPTSVYNEQAMATPNKAPKLEPHSSIATIGDINAAVGYVPPPQMPQQLFAMGQTLEQDNSSSMGQPLNLGGQGSAGLVRGGSGAFESLLANTNVRNEFLGYLIEMDWMQPLIYRTLFEMQMLSAEEQGFVKRGDSNFIRVSATQSEIRNAYDVRLSLRAKMRGGINEESMALTRYIQVYKGNPYIDQQAALETVQPDPSLNDRLIATPEQIEKNLEMLQKQAAAQAAPEQGEAGQTQGEQALQGGAANRGPA